MKKFIFSSFLLLSAFSLPLSAETINDLLTLDLEELATVSVASKHAETIDAAPGIISIVTADQIRLFGYRNLRDILDRQTHMQVIGSNLFPLGRISLRGSTFTHTDNTVLPMLNGRPIRDAFSVSNNHDFYESFPINAIKQIEIIRGPGSVLYGTNAFAGIINIITQDVPETPGASVAIGYGSFDSKKLALSGSGKWGDFEVLATANIFQNDGDEIPIIDELGVPGLYQTGSSGGHALVNARYKGWTVNAMVSDVDQDQLRSSLIFPASVIETEKQFVDIGYRHSLGDRWDVSANVLYNRIQMAFFIDPVFQAENDFNNIFMELTAHGRPADRLGILAGFSYNMLGGDGQLGDLGYDGTFSAYLQGEYQWLEWLKFITGVQYNKPGHLGGSWSPRVAAIARISENWTLKLLYGEAFREASPVERFVNVPQLVGNVHLEPETIKTFDAGLTFRNNLLTVSATYFHSKQTLIDRVGITPQRFENAGTVTFDGVELEAVSELGHGFAVNGNFSYQTNAKDDGTTDVTYAPDIMFKTGLTYRSEQDIFTIAIHNSYFAASTLQNRDINPTVAGVNHPADGYNLLTANLSFDAGKYTPDSMFSGMQFTLYADNLLDERIFFPSISRVTVNSIPQHMGRGFYATITASFD